MKPTYLLKILILLAVAFLSYSECAKDLRGRRTRNRFLHRLNDEDEDASDNTWLGKPSYPSPDDDSTPSPSEGKWVSDNSDEILIDENKVRCLTSNSGGKFNVVWKNGKGERSGDHYWEITLDRVDQLGDVAVGFTNDERFNKDEKTQGLLYGGNLGNGQETLVEEFGPRFKTGDKLGLLASYTNKPSKLKVFFYHNKRSLGMAFDVDQSVLPNARPMIQFGSSASASIVKKDKPNSRQRSKSEESSSISGTWKIQSKTIKFNGTQFNTENIKDRKVPLVTLSIIPKSGEEFEEECTSVMRVHNEIRFRTDKYKSSWRTYHGTSAKQNVPDNRLKSLENNLLAMTKVGTLSLSNYKLVFKKDKTKSEATFERYDPKPQPITENPFIKDKPSECQCPCSQY